MKGTLYRTLLGLPPALLTLVGAVTFVSCVDDSFEESTGTSNVLVPVTIGISADNISDFCVTRADYDENAEEGEFMNTLCVFVVDESGKIEVKLQPNLTSTDADTGNLPEWTSDKLSLKAGTKTIYAFANWETVVDETDTSDPWALLIAKEVGETITSTDLNFLVDDPASKVDIAEGKYIPMSGGTTVTIDAGSDYDEPISVGMDRLVGKVIIAVKGDATTDVTLDSLLFTGWADKVPLMKDDDTEGYEITYDKGYRAKLNQSITADATDTIATFYVNETYRSSTDGGFAISLDTDKYGGLTYTATTLRTDIPRNNIYPILLTLDTYELELTPTAWTSILGVDAELEYDSPITVDEDTCYITMLEVTSTFSITPSLVNTSDESTVSATWDWTYVDEDGTSTEVGETASEGAMPACTVDGNGVLTATTLTATPGYEYDFTLEAAWTEEEDSNNNSVAHSRLYNVKVIFEEGFPTFKQASRAWWTRSYGSELLRMKVR